MAGSGKSTLGKKIYKKLKERNSKTVFLDGDVFREMMDHDLGHSLADRKKNGWRMARVCRFLDHENIDVVCSVLSIFHDHQAWNRKNYKNYFEVYLEVPYEVLRYHDKKGLYSGAESGRLKNVVGVDIPFTPPVKPDLTLFSDRRGGDDTLAQTKKIMRALAKREYTPR